MIAPAMKTRQDEPLRYVELARQGARVERSLAGSDLPRWGQLVEAGWSVQIVLEFSRDARGLSWVTGEYQARAGMLCTRCSEVLGHALSGQLTMCIVGDEGRASELASTCEVLVAHGDTVLLADIIEDELLLALPEQLCVTDECERMLPLAYPGAGEAPLEQPESNPFDVLAALKQKHR